MTIKLEGFKKLINDYKGEIDNSFKRADYIISIVGKSDEELVNEVYDASYLRMCIMYEAFTTDAYRTLMEQKKVSFNKPWFYTREIAGVLGIDITNEYKNAHEGWEIYNALKHINNSTETEHQKVIEELNLKNSREQAKFIHTSLINLLNKLDEKK